MNSPTALRAFITDLRAHGVQLRSTDRRLRRSRMLEEFKSFKYGEDDAFFPRDGGWRPWRKHCVAVSRAQLILAGYPEFYKTCRWMPDADPWRHVYWGGEVPLWPWASTMDGERETRLGRARFLERLADVLESQLQRITSSAI